MPFKIDRFPQGLNRWLSLFGGEGPNHLEDHVRGIVDLRDNYGAALLVGTTGTPAVGAIGTGLSETLTLTVTLRVRSVGARLTVGAAAVTGGGYIEVGVNVGGTLCPLGGSTFDIAAAGATMGFGVPCDMVLPAGSIFYAAATGTAAGADHSLALGCLIENWNQP